MDTLSSGTLLPTLQDTISRQAASVQRQLTSLSKRAHGETSELRQGIAEFASLLVFQMLQAMRRTVPRSELVRTGFAHDLYTSLLDQEIARHIARREAMGLVPLLRQELDAHRPPPTPTEDALAAYQKQSSRAPDLWSRPAYGRLTSGFGFRQDPFTHKQAWHNGIDIAAPSGSIIRAAAAGRVVFDGRRPGYGNLLIIEHPGGVQTYYAHNAENLVTLGTEVARAQPIARVGQSGRATGPHIHFELRQQGEAVDPSPFLTAGPQPRDAD